MADWNSSNFLGAHGNFEALIPLNMIFGFAEDYQKIIVNGKHELTITRSITDRNAVIQTNQAVTNKNTFQFTFLKIEWLMPVVILTTTKKASLLKFIEKDPIINASFRSWELHKCFQIPETLKHTWTVKNFQPA